MEKLKINEEVVRIDFIIQYFQQLIQTIMSMPMVKSMFPYAIGLFFLAAFVFSLTDQN